MAYRKSTCGIIASDGTRLAVHTHLSSVASEDGLAGRVPVLLTNGMGTTENFWRYLVEDLERDHRVVHWDYRGHGQSGLAISGDYGLRTQAEDLARVTQWVMEGAASAPIHVAFSMGVTVLLELLRAHPERIRAMVLIAGAADAPFSGSGPFRLPFAMPALRLALRALQPAVPLLGPLVQKAIRTPLSYPAARVAGLIRPTAPKPDIEQFVEGVSNMEPMAYFSTLRALFDADATEVLPQVRVPTLVISAANDILMPRAQVARLVHALPAARHVEVPDAGHAGLIEAGPVIRAEVRAMIDSLDASLERPLAEERTAAP